MRNNIILHLINKEELTCDDITIMDGFVQAENIIIPASSIVYIQFPQENIHEQEPIAVVTPVNRKQFNDDIRRQLWEELKAVNHKALFSGREITQEDMKNHEIVTVDHIIPIAKGGTNDMENLTLEFKDENTKKGNMMPLDYMKSKGCANTYNITVHTLRQGKHISKEKFKRLLQQGVYGTKKKK